MHAETDVLDLVARLKARSEAFCLATVVRTVSVTAAKAGAKAVISADGVVSEGWIGGGCARAAVLKAAREALADGHPRLVSILPEDALAEKGLRPGEEREGIRFARNMCPSRGTMDVFVEPMLPRPILLVLGASPVAVAVADLAPRFGFAVTVCAGEDEQNLFSGPDARVVGYAQPALATARGYALVSTQGRGDAAALAAALESDAVHIGFVGSRRKIEALQRALATEGDAPDRFDRLKAPAGLDIGAITPEEIALSVLAEIVALRRRDNRNAAIR